MFCNDILFELVLVRLKDDRRRGEFAACFALTKARLSRMILYSVAAVSHLSLGVPLMFI